ncbi:undecaprenyl-diphosphate phosphatase [Vogesella sp. LIG4]|uniref:undecaprenyl-diphosphate phosphatase n=1 Tax=Vogesella sp. LIG4 TaxID=1192162 RepID=UPI00081FBB09|nr:undecaprenyl-diphosphate phosphatase [Vogesella sp. LIG4]SCK09214.1 undecaprenyl-diphosphatase [Vogesella sp. LIG4]
MDTLLLAQALLLGIVEGLTEFLPVSSTGHLIVVGDLIGFQNAGKVFEIAIQFGAILAVLVLYRERFLAVAKGLGSDAGAQRFAANLLLAFLPAAVIGLLFIKQIKHYLFNPVSVAAALIVGGLVILYAERRRHVVTVHDVDAIAWRDALKIGCAQVLAMIPGTSRSGATIIGGMFFGLDRKVAAEFSFFLAVPTMFAATVYDLYKHRDLLSLAELPMFAIGFVAAFLSALLAVRTLVSFVGKHSFEVFAWYRIAFGLVILATWHWNFVDWST